MKRVKTIRNRNVEAAMKHTNIISFLQHSLALTALLVLMTGAPLSIMGQTTASLSGNVQDKSGAVVANARVVLTNVDTKDRRELQSNPSGYFTFAGIVPGSYVIEISATGFRSLRQADIMVNPGDIRTLPNLSLEVGTATENVTVRATLITLHQKILASALLC
jgi:hypothetical protein